MFLDTETTGLSKFDRIVQIAWQLYSKDSFNLISSNCFIIKPTDFKISHISSKIHGITTKIAYERGIERGIILDKFRLALLRSDLVIAHNMNFDDRMIKSELNRLGNDSLSNLWSEKSKVCTMNELRGIYGKQLKYSCLAKINRLSDAYQKLTGQKVPDNIHTADVDTEMCAQVYFELERSKSLQMNSAKESASGF